MAFGLLVGKVESDRWRVELDPGLLIECHVLRIGGPTFELSIGDSVLVAWPGQGYNGCAGVVLGRIGDSTAPASLVIEATESLTLKCGDASVDLRADGKVMVRGDDVLIRAKGTQRIRAGNVAIN